MISIQLGNISSIVAKCDKSAAFCLDSRLKSECLFQMNDIQMENIASMIVHDI
jgi:hypothetical protein